MDPSETEALLIPKTVDNSLKTYKTTEPDKLLLDNDNMQKSFLQKIDFIDKAYSNFIHFLELPPVLEIPVYAFARIYNPDLMVCYFLIMFVYNAIQYNNYFFVLKPLLHVIFTLVITVLSTYVIGRPRPDVPDNVHKMFNCRNKETNCSMPSGDAMQAGNIAVVLLFYFGSWIGFVFIPFVMFARIFYCCHYIMDTVVGAITGIGLSIGIFITLEMLSY